MKSISPFVFAVCCAVAPASAAEPNFDEHLAAQRAIEQVYWSHRSWPADNPTPKPALRDVLSDTGLRTKLTRALARTAAVESELGRPITRAELQAEVQRMIRESRRPDVLDELFAALGRDPVLIEDLLARPLVVEKLASAARVVETPDAAPCESWRPTATAGAPVGREGHTAVWTGAEMIVWGGNPGYILSAGGRYDPATDGWTPISTVGTPAFRYKNTAVWTGTKMIVWGGYDGTSEVTQDGGRYDVTTDSWAPTTLLGAPSGRYQHVAAWTGSEMLVWGGCTNGSIVLDPLVHRYRPDTDSWLTSSSAGPTGQCGVVGVWTGSELLLFGTQYYATAHRYALASDTWSEMSSVNLPYFAFGPTGVWTGTEMIVWGGSTGGYTNSGGRYAPATDTWLATPTAGAPSPRFQHTAVWSGSEMIVWGGAAGSTFFGDGARYDPVANIWAPLPATGAPSPRGGHSAVWTGDEMIVWGGLLGDSYNPIARYNTGARYSAQPIPETCNGVDDDCNGVVDDGASCDDGNPCNGLETCGGVNGCLAGNPTVCTASDQCHDAGVCDPGSGLCSDPAKADGSTCDDGDPLTSGDSCQVGACVGAITCPASPDPKTKGYYKKLCNNDHVGDALTDADAACVAGTTATFSGISTVADICDVLQPGGGGGNDSCDREEDQLLVLALNLCKQRVCTAQEIDSRCGSNSKSVGESLAEMDAIFADPNRDRFSCDHAGCLGEEINGGRALKLNSLSLALETGR